MTPDEAAARHVDSVLKSEAFHALRQMLPSHEARRLICTMLKESYLMGRRFRDKPPREEKAEPERIQCAKNHRTAAEIAAAGPDSARFAAKHRPLHPWNPGPDNEDDA